jgi:hypothetical protein
MGHSNDHELHGGVPDDWGEGHPRDKRGGLNPSNPLARRTWSKSDFERSRFEIGGRLRVWLSQP